MKNKKKVIIWILILLIVAFLLFGVLYRIFRDQTRLTPQENEWINENLNKVINVTVLNDTNLFGLNGKGLFYDFLNDFATNYGLRFNSITYNSNESSSGIRFGVSNVLTASDVNFYQDHYVLVSKKNEVIVAEEDLKDKTIGVMSDSLTYLKNQLSVEVNFVSYASRDDLLQAFEKGTDIQYICIPRIEYMDTILSKDYRISYHFTNVPRYYNLILDETNQPLFSSILRKYFIKWNEKLFVDSFHEQEFQMFVTHLNISQTQVDQLQSVVYNYGFINTHPYEVLMGGNYGGILAAYFREFSEFSNVEFNFKRYKNYKKLTTAINEGKVDLYFEYQNFTSGGEDIPSDIILSYDILAPSSSDVVVQSLSSLKGKTVYVENNSFLQSHLASLENVEVLTYEGEKGLKDVVRKKGILVLDHYLSLNYKKDILKSYSVRYTAAYSDNYFYKSHANETFTKLFTRYVDYLDENVLNYRGLYNYSVTLKHGTILGTLAKYSLYIIIIFVCVFFFAYRSSKKVRLAKKLRREDRLKFIDQLTSLKNRNYLNDNISKWNKNTIYPQAVLVIDLNGVQEINDTYGYEEGDRQIQHAANILVKTQLDNTDVMRTDGNEFMVYFVGYQMKQITAYIHKLNKEFKNLPYPNGVCIGYSMIENDMKLVSDAINEATIDVKKQKKIKKEDVS